MSSLQDLQAIEEELDQTISELAPLLSTPKKANSPSSTMTEKDGSPDSASAVSRNLQEEIELEGEETMQDALEEQVDPSVEPEKISKPKEQAQLKAPPKQTTALSVHQTPDPSSNQATVPASPTLITMTNAQLQQLLASMPSRKSRRN